MTNEEDSKRILKSTLLYYAKINLICATNSPAVNVACTHTKDLHEKTHSTSNSLGLAGRQAKTCPIVLMCSITETLKKISSLCLNSGGKELKTYHNICQVFLNTTNKTNYQRINSRLYMLP